MTFRLRRQASWLVGCWAAGANHWLRFNSYCQDWCCERSGTPIKRNGVERCVWRVRRVRIAYRPAFTIVSSAQLRSTGLALNVALALARRGQQVVLAANQALRVARVYDFFGPVEVESVTGVGTSVSLLDGQLSLGPFGLRLLESHHLDAVDLSQLADLAVVSGHPQTVFSGHDICVYVVSAINTTILDAYAQMKSHRGAGGALAVASHVDTEAEGWEVLKRFCDASGDHSDRCVIPAAVITATDAVQLDAEQHPVATPPVLKTPNSDLTKRIDRIAEWVGKLQQVDRRFVANATST